MTAPCPLPTYPVYRSATQAKRIRQGMRLRDDLTVIRCHGHAHIVMNLTNRNWETR